MIKNLIFGFYFPNSSFLVESLKVNKTSKKDHSFYNTISLKKPHSFYEPQLTQHYEKIYSCNTVKHMFLVEVKKNLHCTTFRRLRIVFSEHLESKYLYIPLNLCS